MSSTKAAAIHNHNTIISQAIDVTYSVITLEKKTQQTIKYNIHSINKNVGILSVDLETSCISNKSYK